MVDSKRILFCNITYMKYYQGITEEDKPTNDGAYVENTGDAMEQRLDEIMDIGKCNLLKVPYHGRKLDNFKDF
ncbi:MAG: hypothetical protein IIT39_11955, partial [Clostridia bacterium]|nr:hypothetical protein [Clostridia bacterium]